MENQAQIYYRPEDLATDLDVTRQAIYQWIRQGRIRVVPVGSQLRIPVDEYRRILSSGVQNRAK